MTTCVHGHNVLHVEIAFVVAESKSSILFLLDVFANIAGQYHDCDSVSYDYDALCTGLTLSSS